MVLMAKMHTGGHGKSKSRKPNLDTAKPIEGASKDKKEIEEIIEKYAKQNMHQAQIGQALKEKHNVPYIKQLFGKRLGKILQEKGVNKGISNLFINKRFNSLLV